MSSNDLKKELDKARVEIELLRRENEELKLQLKNVNPRIKNHPNQIENEASVDNSVAPMRKSEFSEAILKEEMTFTPSGGPIVLEGPAIRLHVIMSGIRQFVENHTVNAIIANIYPLMIKS